MFYNYFITSENNSVYAIIWLVTFIQKEEFHMNSYSTDI